MLLVLFLECTLIRICNGRADMQQPCNNYEQNDQTGFYFDVVQTVKRTQEGFLMFEVSVKGFRCLQAPWGALPCLR